MREVKDEDVERLLELKIKRISRYDILKCDENLKTLNKELELAVNNLNNIVEYTINYYRRLKQKYGKGQERCSQLRVFTDVKAADVILTNLKFYMNYEDGFAGTAVKDGVFIDNCSELDDFIFFRKNGYYMVQRVSDKVFIGKDVVYIGIYKKDDNKVYNVIYQDGIYSETNKKMGNIMVKRFKLRSGLQRDKEYCVTKGSENSILLYISVTSEFDNEIVTVYLKYNPKLKRNKFDFNFSSVLIKGRDAWGKILTRYSVYKILCKEKQISETEIKTSVWYDSELNKLNNNNKGIYIGDLGENDKVLAINKFGSYQIYDFSISIHFDTDVLKVEKYDGTNIITLLYSLKGEKYVYVKRFKPEIFNKRIEFVDKEKENIILITTNENPIIEIVYNINDEKTHPNEEINIGQFNIYKDYKVKGKKLSKYEIKKVTLKN